MNISTPTIDVIEALVELDACDDGAGWSAAMFVEEFDREYAILRIATVDDRIVGFIVVSRYGDEWHVMNITVNADFRQQGIANRLVESAFAETSTIGITLEVRATSEPAIALYKRHGFTVVGMRPKYFPLDVDALIMTRSGSANG